MGIKNLHPVLKRMCPQVYREVPLSKYAYKKVALDLSIYMYKYKSSSANMWLDAFVQLIYILRKNDVHFVAVYDSKAPPEKDLERKQRSDAREKQRDRVRILRDTWDQFQEDHQGQDLTPEIIRQNPLLHQFVLKNLNGEAIASRIENELVRMQYALMKITSSDFDLTKELFRSCGIPVLQAEGEAEATCALLNREGLVSAVITDDTDVLAYRTPIMLSKIDYQKETCIEIDLQEVLCALRLTESQFLDFCILCGTDYNTNMPKIGPERSYRLILEHGSLDAIQEAHLNLPMEILNYPRVRQLFSPRLLPGVEVPFCDFPDHSVLSHFFFVHNIPTGVDKIRTACETSQFHCFLLNEGEEEETTKEKIHKNNLLLIK